MRRFSRSYYVLNVLLILSYFITRQRYLGGDTAYGRIAGPSKLVQWEWRELGVLPLASCIHAIKVRAPLVSQQNSGPSLHNPCCLPSSARVLIQ